MSRLPSEHGQAGLELHGPVVSASAAQADQPKGVSRNEARSGMRRLQTFIGFAFLASVFSGAYLLATDGSLWLLALSHAVGLVVIVGIDAVLGVLNLLYVKRVYLASLAAALLGLVLQLGDILTAPQYNMTLQYFASYLFALPAFDLLLFLQVSVIALGVAGRGYAQNLARSRVRRRVELSYSRRGFFKSMAGFAAIVIGAVLLGSVKIPVSSSSSQTSQSGLPNGAIADSKSLQVGSPVYFDYPNGYPNLLLKKNDGSLAAVSVLCTHVCCSCEYQATDNVIFCPCHGSIFDAAGRVLQGPAITPLPTVELRIDSAGYVYPTAIKGTSPCLQA